MRKHPKSCMLLRSAAAKLMLVQQQQTKVRIHVRLFLCFLHPMKFKLVNSISSSSRGYSDDSHGIIVNYFAVNHIKRVLLTYSRFGAVRHNSCKFTFFKPACPRPS